MAKTKADSSLSDYAQLLFPPGWLFFLGAAVSMMLSLGILIGLFSSLLLAKYEVEVRTGLSLIAVVVLAMVLVHPTFMLIKGKRWARPFLKRYNIFCILFLALGSATHLLQGKTSQFYTDLGGLLFALIAFKLYRSKGFARFCEHFCMLWDAYRRWLKTGR